MRRVPISSVYWGGSSSWDEVAMPIFARDYIADVRQVELVEQLWAPGSEGTNFVRLVIAALNSPTRRLTTCK